MSQKTEPPTPRRISKSRLKGDVPVSSYASQAAALCVAVVTLPAASKAIAVRAADLIRAGLLPHSECPSPTDAIGTVLKLSLPFLAVVGATSALASVVQSGGLFAASRILPDVGRFDPIRGLRSLFGVDRLWVLARSLAMAGCVMWLALTTLRGGLSELAHTEGRPFAALGWASATTQRLIGHAALLGLFVALADIVLTRRAFFGRLRMSKAEVEKERAETEGNPHVRSARDRAHRELLNMATVHAVEDATVVIANSPSATVALRYVEGEDSSPTVVARGQGNLSRRLEQMATIAGIPVVRDPSLANALADLPIGDPIPEALYERVAALIARVWDGTPDAG